MYVICEWVIWKRRIWCEWLIWNWEDKGVRRWRGKYLYGRGPLARIFDGR